MVIKRAINENGAAPELPILAQELAAIAQEKEKLEARDKAIRAVLMERTSVGFLEMVNVNGQDYKVGKFQEEVTVLKTTDQIFDLVNLDNFLKIASVSLTRVKDVIGKDHAHLIAGYDPVEKIKVLKVKK